MSANHKGQPESPLLAEVLSQQVTLLAERRGPFAALVKSGAAQLAASGRYFRIAVRPGSDQCEELHIANASKIRPSSIDRDDAWRRRIELTSLLRPLLHPARVLENSEAFRLLILRVLTALYREAFDDPAEIGDVDVLRTFFENSQERIDQEIDRWFDGSLPTYAGYGDLGPVDRGYSHIKHFAHIYAEQIRLLSKLQVDPSWTGNVLTVVDIGTGGASFLRSLARVWTRHKELRSWCPRLRLVGIDRSDRDMRLAREELRRFESEGFETELLVDDAAAPNFAHRLRQLKPDLIVANHLLEHLPGDLANSYLHDWLQAADYGISMSFPLNEPEDAGICDHCRWFKGDDLEALAASMERRTSEAIRSQGLDRTKKLGLLHLIKDSSLKREGGFRGDLLTVTPREVAIAEAAVYSDFEEPYNPRRFEKAQAAPRIGKISNRDDFASVGGLPQQIRQMPIKMPRSEIIVPAEFAQFQEAIELIAGHNLAINSAYDESYAYLNVFRGLTRFDSYRGLSLQPHGDQMQGLDPGTWYRPDYSYIVSSTLPTTLYLQGFDLAAAIQQYEQGRTVDLYDFMREQADSASIYHSENFGIYLLSPYIVHSASLAESDVERVFLKVAFSIRRLFDNRELRRNPAFVYDDWYKEETLSRSSGWFQHGHWNERYMKSEIVGESSEARGPEFSGALAAGP